MEQREAEAAVREGRPALLLAAYDCAEGVATRRWLRSLIERAVELSDPGSIDEATRSRFSDLGFGHALLALASAKPENHAVHVPLSGRDGGVCRLMHVTFDASGTATRLGGLDASAQCAVEDAVALAERRLGRMPSSGFFLVPAVRRALEGQRVHGRSLGAAALVSAVSLFSHRSVRPGTAITGTLVRGELSAIGRVEAKVSALVGRPDIRRLIVPRQDEPAAKAHARSQGIPLEVLAAASVDELLALSLENDAPRLDVEGAVEAARRTYSTGWQGYHWAGMRHALARLAGELPDSRPDLCVRVYAMLGAVTRNLGAPVESADILEQALAMLDSEEADVAVPDAERTFLWRHLSITYKQLCRFEEARQAADLSIELSRRGRLRRDLTMALGCAGLVALSQGEPERAVEYQREALMHAVRHSPAYAPRTGSYLVEALGRAGDVEAARRVYSETLSLLRELGPSKRTQTDEIWLRTTLSSALSRSCPEEVIELLGTEPVERAIAELPLPGLLARRWLGLSEIGAGFVDRGLARLAASPASYGGALEPHVRFLAHLNVLHEARARVSLGAFDDDARARAEAALENLPQTEQAAAFLLPAAVGVLALLRDAPGSKVETGVAFDTLLERCARLS